MSPPSIDPRSGFSPTNRTFYSVRPETPLPPESFPISAAEFALSLFLSSPLPPHPALLDTFSSASLSFPTLLSQSSSLATALRSYPFNLSPGSVAFILSPSRLEISVLYLALISIGVVVSPANPASSSSEISYLLALSKSSIAFSVSSVASKIPSQIPTVILDSPSFTSLISSNLPNSLLPTIKQSDTAAILYSSGTTGRVKGVALTHRNLIACIADTHAHRINKLAEAAAAGVPPPPQTVTLFTIPLFHVFGFFMLFRSVALGETTVLMERFEFGAMLKAIEKHKVTFVPAAPPLIVGLAKSPDVLRFDLSSLDTMLVGGAQLGRELAEQFVARFPNVELVQGYGLTESCGGGSTTIGPEESKIYGSAGRLGSNLEAKIVDPATGEALGPCQRGELWFRGPIIMKDDSFDWIIITSPEAGSVFLDAWKAAGNPRVQVGVVGQGTASTFLEASKVPDQPLQIAFSPSKATGKVFAIELPRSGQISCRVLYPASVKASNEIEDGLSGRGFDVLRLNTYDTVPVQEVDPQELEQALLVPVVAVASPSALRAWVNLVSNFGWDNSVACIGETTAAAAKRLGLTNIYYPKNPGIEGWIESILEALNSSNQSQEVVFSHTRKKKGYTPFLTAVFVAFEMN